MVNATTAATSLTLVLTILLAAPRATWAQGLFEEAVEEAEADAEQSDATASTPARTFELGGFVRSDLFVGKRPDRDEAEIKAGYGEGSLQVRARTGKLGDGFAELRARTGLLWGERTSSVDAREAYVNLYLGPFDLRLGHQIVAWGRADGFNPTDNVTPRDMSARSADEDDRRLGNLALRLFFNAQPLRVEGIWVPFFAPSRFPRFEIPAPLELGEADYPDPDLSGSIGALRTHLVTGKLDASLSYLAGPATFPVLVLQEVTAGPPPAATVAFSTYRHQVVGLDFATTVGDWVGLRGEAAWRRPFDYDTRAEVPRPDLQVVLGVDREIEGVSVIAQYVGRYVTDFEALPGAPPPGADTESIVRVELVRRNRIIHQQPEEIAHAASLRVEYKLLQETLTLAVLGLYGFSTEELLARPTISYQIADALEVVLGAELYRGPADTLFGMADEELSSGFIEARASF